MISNSKTPQNLKTILINNIQSVLSKIKKNSVKNKWCSIVGNNLNQNQGGFQNLSTSKIGTINNTHTSNSTNSNNFSNINNINNMTMNSINNNVNMMNMNTNMNMNMNYGINGINSGLIMNPNFYPMYNPYQGMQMNMYQVNKDMFQTMYNPHNFNDIQNNDINNFYINQNHHSKEIIIQTDRSEKKPKMKKKKKKEN